MKSSKQFAWAIAASCLALSLTFGGATQAQEFEPKVGQEGKDVIWVPTSQTLVDKMLDAAQVTANDYVIDLGSGDGRTVITAAKRGAKALGIEYNPKMVELSQRNADREGVSGKASFVQADLFQSDLSPATVITMFLLPEINLQLRPKILDLRPGTRIVSNSFTMGDWTADKTVEAREDCTSYCKAFYWVVPAKVAGTWRMPAGELTLEQKYQTVSGTLKTKTGTVKIANGKLAGDQITFMAGSTQYSGRVNGGAISGTARAGGKESNWQATRS
jgi:hypothetical protein